MWLLNKLTETYATEVAVEVHYIHLPEGKAPIVPLPEKLHLTVRAMGIDIIKQLKLRTPQTVIDYEKHANASHRITTANLIHYLEAQLDNIQVTDIKPDTIRFVFDKIATRKVPIKVNADIETAAHFNLKKVEATLPDSVSITGAVALVDTLKYWHTESLMMRDVSQSATGEIALVKPQNGIVLSTDATTYQVTIEEYTEKSLLIPIEILNLPKGVKVFLYPRAVTVYFQVVTNNFNDIDESYFSVKADFANYDIAHNNRIDVAVSQAPAGIKNIRAKPPTAEYIIIE